MSTSILQIAPVLFLLDVRAWKDGKEFRRREKFTGSKKAAETRFHELRKELYERAKKNPRSLKSPDKVCSTFGEVINFYLKRNEIGDSKHYFDRLKVDLGNFSLNDMADSFDRWLLLLRQGRSARTGRPLTPATINRFIAWSKAALNFCLSYGMIEENPLAHIKKAKEIPRDIVLNDIDKQNLFNILEKEAPYLVPLVRFALLVPCRTGELIQMRRDDLDLFNNAIRVRCGIMKNKEMAAWKPIPPSMRPYFQNLPSSSEYLFPRQIGGRFKQIKAFPYKTFRHCLKQAGLKGWRLHDARHEAISSMLNFNTPEIVVSQIAGWTSSAMLRTYYHRDGLQAVKMARFQPENPAKPDSVRLEKAQAV